MKYSLLVFIVSLLFPVISQANEYPGRKIYITVPVYETEQLNQSFNDVIVVDVRSKFEYDTLHINKSINIPLNNSGFTRQLEALQAGTTPILFYCNGHSCIKSYKAVLKAHKAGFTNVFSYDSGIFDWSKAHPDKSTLLGKSPLNPDRLISKSELKNYLIKPEQFSSRINDKSIVLDIREPTQRGLIELYPYQQENISLDDRSRLDKFLSGIKKSGKTLLVYDEVGKQVRWFQYYLADKGITKYFFMEGGVKQFFKDGI